MNTLRYREKQREYKLCDQHDFCPHLKKITRQSFYR